MTLGYENSRFPILKEGDTLSATQVQLLAAAIRKLTEGGGLRRTTEPGDRGTAETGGAAANARAFVCDENSCMCAGDDDCNDMFSGSTCGPDAVCLSDGQGSVVCICIPA